MTITPDIVKEHGLTTEEYDKVLKIMGREPTITELGIFSVMWSEHCSYKTSRIHLKGFPVDGPQVIQGPGENAGIVDIGDGMACAFKVESHNHPSYIEPYQGAATGVGGIMRDVFTMGARPVANLNSLRFGGLNHAKTKHLLEGVVAGIAGYGNCMGVPTVGGEVWFNESYNGNCLVNAMNVGLVNADSIFLGTAEGVGNPIIYVGSKTGRDGIHGATMASDTFEEGEEGNRPTVQVGDPFTEKLLLEACMELFATDSVIGIQDMGAAGLTSSSVEMASRGGAGVEIDVLNVPRREEGMTPYEIMLSESQERMLMVVKQGAEDTVKKIFDKWDLDAAVIGKVTDTGRVVIKEGSETVADLPAEALTEEAPMYDRPYSEPKWYNENINFNFKEIFEPTDFSKVLIDLLESPNLASRHWVFRQYDHMVGVNTTTLPGSDAGIIRVREDGGTGKLTDKALAMTLDCNSRYCYLDPYEGAKIAVAEAARNLSVSGAKPLALTDCLNFGDPTREEVMWQFVRAVEGIKEACKELHIPVISGNVSLYNETSGVAVHPTPTIGMVGLIEDYRKQMRCNFRASGDIIVLLGETFDELGGSEYLKVVHKLEKGAPPKLDFAREKALHEALRNMAGIASSAHDLSEGGLAVGLAECCFSAQNSIGCEVDVDFDSFGFRMDSILFGESQSRAIISVHPDKLGEVKAIAEKEGVKFTEIGKVGGDLIRINDIIKARVQDLYKAWHEFIPNYMGDKI